MEDRTEVIKQQMQDKRAEMTDKLQVLERHVTNGIGDAAEAVTDTVASVTGNVQETVTTVKDALDISKHVEEHPWLAVGGAVLVGFLAHGYLTQKGSGPNLAEGLGGLNRLAAQAALALVGKAVNTSGGESGSVLGQIVEQLTAGLTGASNPESDKGGPK